MNKMLPTQLYLPDERTIHLRNCQGIVDIAATRPIDYRPVFFQYRSRSCRFRMLSSATTGGIFTRCGRNPYGPPAQRQCFLSSKILDEKTAAVSSVLNSIRAHDAVLTIHFSCLHKLESFISSTYFLYRNQSLSSYIN